jgi:adhesin/invasin
LTLDKAAKGYTIQAVTTGLTQATTKSFNIVPAAATQLVVTTQPPASVQVLSPFGMAVSAEDPYGNVVTSETGQVSIALKNNPGGSTLSGRLTIAFSSGVARFSGLRLNEPGDGYTIQATTTGLTPAVTDPFDVTSRDSLGLVLTTQTPVGIAGSGPLAPVRSVEEGFGTARTTTYTSSVSAPASNPSANGTTVVDIGPLTVTDSNGVTTISGLALNKPGKGSRQPDSQ